MATGPNHWGFYQIPPFFTLQPAPAAVVREATLWGNLIMDHAAHHAPNSPTGTSAVLRLYKSTSDVFYNAALNRRLPPSAARVMLEALATQRPNHCSVLTSSSDEAFSVLVACNAGGMKALESALLQWILQRGVGTTTASLASTGVVMTFDELVEGRCLSYKREGDPFMKRLAEDSVPIPDVAALTEEEAIRALLESLAYRPVSILRPFHVTLFNLDGSDKKPYQGVKFGG